MYSKKRRLEKILELIKEKEIQTQDELVTYLNDDGFNVTQATVSRDIKNLRLIKAASDEGVFVYSRSEQTAQITFDEKLREIFSHSVTSISPAGNIIVVKTLSGAAQAAASAIDSADIDGILGSIGGDDTIMIVTKSEKASGYICARLSEMRG
ncbi:MAG: arginine repressor [Firmicutes bacterium]|nr:arginine repressor [Bacillota bacterium]